MLGRAVYQTYRPSSKTWLFQYDETEPGWMMSRSLTDPNAPWIKVRTNGVGGVLVRINNQWVDSASLRQQQAAAAPPVQVQRAPMAGCEPFRGPFMANNVRERLPNNRNCWTPEEYQWNNGEGAARITRPWQSGQSRVICENARAAQPYARQFPGSDGVLYYELRDGSVQPRGGTLNPGWEWTPTSPQLKACY
jgi:hypothetical protein